IGSLGRRSPGPASDLDLVLLLDREQIDAERAAQLAAGLWYPIWDSGTSLDHAVRSPAECAAGARTDLRAALAPLDPRPLAGESPLVDSGAERVRTACRRGARRRA